MQALRYQYLSIYQFIYLCIYKVYQSIFLKLSIYLHILYKAQVDVGSKDLISIHLFIFLCIYYIYIYLFKSTYFKGFYSKLSQMQDLRYQYLSIHLSSYQSMYFLDIYIFLESTYCSKAQLNVGSCVLCINIYLSIYLSIYLCMYQIYLSFKIYILQGLLCKAQLDVGSKV